MLSKEKMKRRNVRKVLRYHTPNAATNAEAYSHHLLMLFFPFRKETELLSEVDKSYFSKLNQPDILAVVNINKEKFEPWGDLVETSLRNFTFQSRTDNYAQQENDDVLDELDEQIEENEIANDEDEIVDFQVDTENQSKGTPQATTLNIMPDDEINILVASLNAKQRELFNLINSWARSKIINMSSVNPVEIEPLQIFITGGP